MVTCLILLGSFMGLVRTRKTVTRLMLRSTPFMTLSGLFFLEIKRGFLKVMSFLNVTQVKPQSWIFFPKERDEFNSAKDALNELEDMKCIKDQASK